MERATPHFHEELDTLKARLLEMGGLAEERVRLSIQALVERDSALVDEVLSGDDPLNRLHIEIDQRGFTLVALHQPVATDLRMIVSAIKINTDLERIGDLAVNIAEAARRYKTSAGEAAHRYSADGVDCADNAARRAGCVRAARPDLAQAVLDRDDRLDGLKTQVFRELLTYMLQDHSTIEPGLDLILVSRHLERIGDHATNIAEDVIFMVSAKDVRHRAIDDRP